MRLLERKNFSWFMAKKKINNSMCSSLLYLCLIKISQYLTFVSRMMAVDSKPPEKHQQFHSYG